MNLRRFLATLTLLLAAVPALPADAELDCPRISQLAREFLKHHVIQSALGTEIEQRAIESYLHRLDTSRSLMLDSEIGELCAQFRRGILAVMRSTGADAVRATVERYHRLFPAAVGATWHPETLARLEGREWQQLYVNAEHDGTVGVVTMSRESYCWDVDHELNRALDWLNAAGIRRVIVTGDFHLSTQMVGADTSDFFPALETTEPGLAITNGWSMMASP